MDIELLLSDIKRVATTPPPSFKPLDTWWTDGSNGVDLNYYIVGGVKMTEEEYRKTHKTFSANELKTLL